MSVIALLILKFFDSWEQNNVFFLKKEIHSSYMKGYSNSFLADVTLQVRREIAN